MTGEGRWGWLTSRPRTMWHVVALALFGAAVGYAMSLVLRHDQVRALTFAVTFGATTLLIQTFRLHRWNAAGRPAEAPPNLPPYGGEWPPAQ